MAEQSAASTIELLPDELACLRLALELYGDAHCPFGDVAGVDAARLEVATRSLVGRGLVDKKGFRPDRDLTRRLLVLSEPDARIVLLAAGPASAERRLDAYERTGVFVTHQRPGERHRIGPVFEPREICEDVRRRFTPRRSTGDFIDLVLDPAEHFAFMSFASELALGAQRSAVITGEIPIGPVEDTLDGAVLLPGGRARGQTAPGQLPVPDEVAWKAALRSLQDKDVVRKQQDGFHLNGFLRDLAVGLVHETRFVLTRFDYSGEAYDSRDVIFVPVPGSLCSLRHTPTGGLEIRELDPRGLEGALRRVIDPPP